MSSTDLPEHLNAATVLVDEHLAQGRRGKPAILCGRQTVTYAQLHEAVNRFGNVLQELGVRMEERVALLLPDSPPWVYVFFGAIKIGAVAVPLNTMLSGKDYEYLLNDSRARVLVVHAALWQTASPPSATGCGTWRTSFWWAARPSARPGACVLRRLDGAGLGHARCRPTPARTTWPSGSTARGPRASPRAPSTCTTT